MGSQKKSNNTFEFRKTKSNLIKEVDLDDNQLINFIDKNRKIDEFLNNIY